MFRCYIRWCLILDKIDDQFFWHQGNWYWFCLFWFFFCFFLSFQKMQCHKSSCLIRNVLRWWWEYYLWSFKSQGGAVNWKDTTLLKYQVYRPAVKTIIFNQDLSGRRIFSFFCSVSFKAVYTISGLFLHEDSFSCLIFGYACLWWYIRKVLGSFVMICKCM